MSWVYHHRWCGCPNQHISLVSREEGFAAPLRGSCFPQKKCPRNVQHVHRFVLWGSPLSCPTPPPYGNPVFPVQPRTVARTLGSQNHSTEIGNIRHPFVSFSCPPLCS